MWRSLWWNTGVVRKGLEVLLYIYRSRADFTPNSNLFSEPLDSLHWIDRIAGSEIGSFYDEARHVDNKYPLNIFPELPREIAQQLLLRLTIIATMPLWPSPKRRKLLTVFKICPKLSLIGGFFSHKPTKFTKLSKNLPTNSTILVGHCRTLIGKGKAID